MTTREAFTALVSSPYLWRRTGQSKNTRRVYKHRLTKDDWPSNDTMDVLLSSAFEVLHEKAWRLK